MQCIQICTTRWILFRLTKLQNSSKQIYNKQSTTKNCRGLYFFAVRYLRANTVRPYSSYTKIKAPLITEVLSDKRNYLFENCGARRLGCFATSHLFYFPPTLLRKPLADYMQLVVHKNKSTSDNRSAFG
jgi:hypothetical protein